MAKIISNGNSLVWGSNQSVFYGSFRLSCSGDYVTLYSGPHMWRMDYRDTTVDGEIFGSAKELLSKLSTFSEGGGNGEGVAGVKSVTGNLVTGTSSDPVVSVPVGTDKDILSWNNEGILMPGRITAWQLTDIGGRPPFAFGVLAGASLQADNPLLLFTEVSNTPKSGTLPIYGTNGRMAVGAAVNPGDAINLGQINGFVAAKADLNDGKVPESQLPSYIDNVQEFSASSEFPNPGLNNVVYVDTSTNLPYRWGGTGYVQIGSGLGLGESVATAYRGDRGKIAYDHSAQTGNPHGMTKSDIDLGSVDNTSDINKPISTATKSYVDNKSSIVAQSTVGASSQTVTLNIPADSPGLLRVEIFIPNTIVPAWISMTFNGVTSSVYRSVIHNVNSVAYTLNRFASEAQIRLLSSANGAVVNTDNIRIEGTINNRTEQLKTYRGTGSAHGTTASTNPDISDSCGSCHGASVTSGKITQIQFRANPPQAGFTAGSRVVVYGIK